MNNIGKPICPNFTSEFAHVFSRKTAYKAAISICGEVNPFANLTCTQDSIDAALVKRIEKGPNAQSAKEREERARRELKAKHERMAASTDPQPWAQKVAATMPLASIPEIAVGEDHQEVD